MAVASNSGLGFDGIAVVTRQGAPEPLYVWSDASGLWFKDPQARRIAERCRGGIAALHHQSTYIACSRPLLDPETDDTEVVLYRLDGEVATRIAKVGRAGRDGHGVALASSSDTIALAFHDGSIGEHAIVLARVRGTKVESARLSHIGQVASDPALLAHDGHVYLAFSELEVDDKGVASSSIWISVDGARAKQVLRSGAYSSTPKLTADARGLVLSFRDRPHAERQGTRNELYVARLSKQLVVQDKPLVVGRANSEGEPFVVGCGALTAAVLPREYGGERYVGINALDAELRSIGAGHQLYENGHDFVQASGACVDGNWWLLAADHASPGQPGSEAVAMHFRCHE